LAKLQLVKPGAFLGHIARGVATAGDTGDASPLRPTMPPTSKWQQTVYLRNWPLTS